MAEMKISKTEKIRKGGDWTKKAGIEMQFAAYISDNFWLSKLTSSRYTR